MALLSFEHFHDNPQQKTVTDKTKTVGARAPKLQLVGARQDLEVSEQRKSPGKARVSLWPDSEILDEVKHFCHLRRITYSQFFELAAVDFIQKTGEKTLPLGARYSPQIDDLDLKPDLDETIINLFEFWTNGYNRKEIKRGPVTSLKLNDRDRAAAAEFRDVDPRIIELGIIQTLSQKQPGSGPIRSFRYYVPEIRQMIAVTNTLKESTWIIQHERNAATMRRWLNLKDQENKNA